MQNFEEYNLKAIIVELIYKWVPSHSPEDNMVVLTSELASKWLVCSRIDHIINLQNHFYHLCCKKNCCFLPINISMGLQRIIFCQSHWEHVKGIYKNSHCVLLHPKDFVYSCFNNHGARNLYWAAPTGNGIFLDQVSNLCPHNHQDLMPYAPHAKGYAR
jgi:hypothetical protein